MLFKTQLASLVLVPLIGLQIPTTQPQDIEVKQIQVLTPQEHIIKYAQEYGVSEKLLLAVATCESSLNVEAVNNNEPNHIQSYGIFQYQKPTWEYFEKKFNVDLDYYNPEHQIKMTAIAFKNGEANHWSCYKKVVK